MMPYLNHVEAAYVLSIAIAFHQTRPRMFYDDEINCDACMNSSKCCTQTMDKKCDELFIFKFCYCSKLLFYHLVSNKFSMDN